MRLQFSKGALQSRYFHLMEKGLPSNVVRFELLMYLSIVVSSIEAPWVYWHESAKRLGPFGALVTTLFVYAVGFGSTLLFIWLIARRRKNWARWLYLVSLLMTLPGSFKYFGELDSVGKAFSLVHLTITTMALIFIFTGDARDWFRSTRLNSSPIDPI